MFNCESSCGFLSLSRNRASRRRWIGTRCRLNKMCHVLHKFFVHLREFSGRFWGINSHLSSSLTFRSPRIQYRQKCMQLWQVPIEKDCDRLAWIKCLEFDLHQESHDSHWTASWMVCARSFGDEGLISHLDFRKLRTPIFSYIQHFLIIRKPVWLIKKCGQSHLGLDDIRMALRWDDDSPLYDSWRTLQ